jgi:hypothetical protein
VATKRVSPSSAPDNQPPSKANRAFAVRRSAIQGRGAFATRDIEKGERLVEYVGERISREEGDLRYDDDAMDRPHTFLFTLDDDTAIDGAVRGNDSRFINHSCGPNCESVIEDAHIYIDAIKRIPAGAELTYDYHLVRPGRFLAAWRTRYECRCGSRNCRGMLLELPKKRATKAAAKKSGAKKSGAKKSGAKKSAKQATARKSGVKAAATRKSGAKTSPAKKSSVNASAAKKSGAKQAAGTKGRARAAAGKRVAGKR